jgi:hypothetical protein
MSFGSNASVVSEKLTVFHVQSWLQLRRYVTYETQQNVQTDLGRLEH